MVAKYAEPDENIVNKTVDTIRDKIQDIKHEQELTTNPDEKAELQKQIEKLKEADVVVRSNRDEIEAKAEESKKNADADNANTAAKSETDIEPAKSDTAASKEVTNEKPATDVSNNQPTPLKKTLEIIRLAKENDAKSLSELVKSVNESEHGKNGDNAINNTIDYVNEFIQKLSENLKTAQNKDAVEYINTALPQLKNISESLRAKRNEIDAYLNGDGTSKATTNQSAGAKLPEDSLAEATDDVERTEAEQDNQQLTSSDSNAIIENEQTQPETQTTSKVEAYKQKLRDAQTRGEFRSVEEILGNPDSDIHYSDLTDADRDEIYKISDEKQIEFNRKEYEAQNAESRTLVDNAVRSIKDGKFDNKGIVNDALAFYDENGNKRETHIVNQLMKDFGIEVPLATQGWFNKRLISFMYKDGESVVRADLKGANGRTLKVPDNVYNYLDILGNKIRESSPDANNSNAESAATAPAANNEVPETTPAQTATAAEQNIAKEPEPKATPSAPVETAETSTTAAEPPTTVTSDGTAETAPAKNKDFYLIYKASKHSKTGEPLDVFEISGGYLSSEQYSKLKKEFEKLGGYYSKYAGGFTFKSGTGSSDERINAVKQFAHVQVNSLHDMPKGKELIGTEYKYGNSNAKVVDYIDNGKYEDEYVVDIDGIGRQKMNYKGVERDIAQYLSDNPTKNTQVADTAASTKQALDMLKDAPSETTTRETTEKEITDSSVKDKHRAMESGVLPDVAPEATTEVKGIDAGNGVQTETVASDSLVNTFYSQIADRVMEEYLSKGASLDINALRDIATSIYGGTLAEGRFDSKDMTDALELAVNRYLLSEMQNKIAEFNGNTAKSAEDGIVWMEELLARIPTQTKRTEEQLALQQFSTPPNIAYLANWLADIDSSDFVLEPSAGIGGLATFAKAFGATTAVNEISERRLGALRSLGFDHVTSENAEQLDNILPDYIKPTVVVMNPPFSSTGGRTKNSSNNVKPHVEQALNRLQDNGRLVAILGQGASNDAPMFAKW